MRLPDRTTSTPTNSARAYPAWANPPPSPKTVPRPAGSDPPAAGLQLPFSAALAATPIPGQASARSAQSNRHNETPLRSRPHGLGPGPSDRQFRNPAAGIPEPGARSLDQNKYPGGKLRRGVLRHTTSVASLRATPPAERSPALREP